MKIKNISGQIKQLYIYEFQIDEELEIDTSWYNDVVVSAIMNDEFQIVGISDKLAQIEELAGHNIISTIVKLPPFGDKTNHRFRGVGKKFTIPANTTQELEHIIPSSTYGFDMDGLEMLSTCVHGNTAHLQVRDDANGTYSGYPNAVIYQFATDWNIKPEVCSKILPYVARLYVGMKIVIVFTNNQSESLDIYVNYNLHEVRQ